MTTTTRSSLASLAVLTLCVAALLLASAPNPAAQTQSSPLPLPLRLEAFAVDMSNVGTGRNGILEIRIANWSTAQERERVVTTMVDKGQDELLDVLQKLPSKGRLRFPNLTGRDPNNLRLGWDIRYAWTTPEPEGGHRIVIALDRVMSFAELRNRPRTVDYPFTLIEIHLNKDGEGEGKMAYATRISFDKKKNVVELENFSSEPVRLTTVKIVKG
jgi:hypothetical protein